jgi:hypothetical protein
MAYIDLSNSLDPAFVARAGVELERLLWIRCGTKGTEKALKAADILAQAGGIEVVVLDLVPGIGKRQTHIPSHIWFRLQRAVKSKPLVLLVLSSQHVTGPAASIVLSVERTRSRWNPLQKGDISLSQITQLKPYFKGIECEVRILKGENVEPVTFYSRF